MPILSAQSHISKILKSTVFTYDSDFICNFDLLLRHFSYPISTSIPTKSSQAEGQPHRQPGEVQTTIDTAIFRHFASGFGDAVRLYFVRWFVVERHIDGFSAATHDAPAKQWRKDFC